MTGSSSEGALCASLLMDGGLGSYCLRTHNITIQCGKEELIGAVVGASDENLPLASTVFHEIHHWHSNRLTSFGFFIGILGQYQFGIGLQHLVVSQIRGDCTRPAADNDTARFVSSNEEYSYALRYRAIRKLREVLLGLDDCTVTECRELMLMALPCFYVLPDTVQRAASGFSSERSRSEMFSRLEQYASTGLMARHRREERSMEHPFTKALFRLVREIMKPLPSINVQPDLGNYERLTWGVLLEGWAKYFQHRFLHVLREITALDLLCDETWMSQDTIYNWALDKFLEETGRPYSAVNELDLIEFMAIADLAANPSLDEYGMPDWINGQLLDFLPNHRFIKAARASLKCPRFSEVGDLEEEYFRFVGSICAELGWETPWAQAKRWLAYYPESTTVPELQFFLESCKMRVKRPLFFGIPYLCLNTNENDPSWRTWVDCLRDLPTPRFFCAETEDYFYLGREADQLVSTAQLDLAVKEILDQVMLRYDEIDFEPVRRAMGPGVNELVALEVLKKLGLSSAWWLATE